MFDTLAAMERAGELIESILADARSLAAGDLADVTPLQLGELLQSVERARAAVDAAANAVLDRFDAQGAAAYDGLRSTSSWLRQRCQMTGATAARRVRTARALRELPEVADGFRSGRFSADQADLFARHHSPRTAEAMTQDESALATLADHLRPDDFARELRGWAELVDTDGAEPDPGHRDRGLTFVQTLDDAWSGRLDLSAADGLVVHRAIEAMAEQLRVPDDDRTRTQRRADALVELVRRGARPQPAPANGGAPRRGAGPRVTLFLTLDAGDLEAGRGADTLDGHHVGPAGTDRLLCDCVISRVLLDPLGGAVLDFGRGRRVVSAAQWSALALRDGGCSFPGCSAPPDECQAHHIVHWRRGGPTDLANLTLACGHHHALVHDGGWDVEMTSVGPRWSRPDGSCVGDRPGWDVDRAEALVPTRTPRLRYLQPVGRAPTSGVPPADSAELVRLARERALALRLTA
jgi:hypothetical protein